MFPDQPGTVVAARRAFLKDHPDAAAKLVKLHLRAIQLIAADRGRAARDAQEYIGKGLIELSTTERALASPSSKFAADPRAIMEACDRLQAFQKETGVIATTVPVADVFDLTFYDAATRK
jgi:NitT/TauT family transport system substrate-binding protein